MLNGANETRDVRIHLHAFILRCGHKTGNVLTMANRYIEGKARE